MSPERALWALYEPVHAIVYFEPSVSGCLADVGLHGFWNGYFAGRAAPLGAVGPAPVTALFFGFAPTMVARALPKVWSRITPDLAAATRFEAVRRVLAPLLEDSADARRATDVLVRAAEGVATDGRALAAAWQAVPHPDDLAAQLWWATTVLREHRGDGHVLAATSVGLTGLEAALTHVAVGPLTREVLQPNRGWTDDEWDAAAGGLVDRGVLSVDGSLTAEGRRLREHVESETDRLARPAASTVADDLPVVSRVLAQVTRAIVATGTLPTLNPMGVPLPR